MTHEHVTVRLGETAIADVSPFLFGALTEHFGSGIYGGIWDSERETTRADVRAAVTALGFTMFRYPGGCFADWYHWRDGIGPRAERPEHAKQFWTGFRFDQFLPSEVASAFELPAETRNAFGPSETNAFGTNEFLQYCVDVGAEPMLVANVGTGDAAEAADWVRYTNRGRTSPRPVRWWGIGNETYGEWELGHCPPSEYAGRFREYARLMKAVDPDLKLVAVGSAGRGGAYPDTWNETVLSEIGDDVDALSVHWYFPGPWVGRPLRDDEGDYLQLAAGSDDLGETLDAALREVDAAVGADRKLPLALDEWNLWPRLEDLLTTNSRLADAVFFSGCYNRLLERADRVRMAMISHLVNCMAPIQTRGDRHFVTSSYLVAMLYRRCARRYAVPVAIECGVLAVPPFVDTAAPEKAIETILPNSGAAECRITRAADAAATKDDSGTTVFLTNRRLDQPVDVDVEGLPGGAEARFRFLAGPGPFAANDVDHPDTLHFREVGIVVRENGTCTIRVPPATVGALIVDR